MTFYKCAHCGNIIAYIHDAGVRCICCGEKMQPLVPNTSDGVKVGSVEHPMLDAHYIEWILLETAEGRQRKSLKPGDKPEAVFMLTESDRVIAAYEYCNLHGLWKADYTAD